MRITLDTTASKYSRGVIYGKIKADIGNIIRDLCDRNGVGVVEAECCPDHMLVTILSHISVSSFMGYLKSKNGLLILNAHGRKKKRPVTH